MAIPDEDVAQVRAATDLVALIGERTALKRVGRRFVGLCPFHAEKTGSFSVNAEEGLYYCFGCQASGDAISFVRATEGVDFVEAVERLANRAGITIRFDDDRDRNEERNRRRELLAAMTAAVDFYHDRLLTHPDAGRARQYLRSRGYDGEIVRKFRLGYAPAGFDELVRALRLPGAVLREAGLAYENERSRLQDAFRERVMFPIFDPGGQAIAFGGRILPDALRASDREPGPKYRNSPESAIYSKRRTLYGLNWAKGDIARAHEVVVCEGYTDVIGFHVAGVPRAVATCGTALTEDHFRLLAHFAKKIVLCFDADAAGQAAAARLYQWEKRHELELAVAELPVGSDPGELAQGNPAALAAAVEHAQPFLGFRVEQALGAHDLHTPEGRSRAAESAVSAIAEHPNELVRDQYLIGVADRTHVDPVQLRELLVEVQSRPQPDVDAPSTGPSQRRDDDRGSDVDPSRRTSRRASESRSELRAGRDALILTLDRADEVRPLFDEVLFVDPVQRNAYRALTAAASLAQAIERADPEASDLLRRLAVSEGPDELDVTGTYIELVRTASEKVLREFEAEGRVAEQEGRSEDVVAVLTTGAWLRTELEILRDPLVRPGGTSSAEDAAKRLVAWLTQRQQEAAG
ncbi:MAG TPA: DNA primase [Acidimicrobiales bacterium]|nr:DNA primase [Acidimicrobiales bacterium]